ncbi:MAG: hypothetical protein JGK36_32375 [Microcoleus sp. PH2017_35_SFW_U_B]|uniref:hypothetical protein n=1 Tax=Microcoleus sp. PH2017_13_LAR_U_A TaxID=2798824 RepID=UPI001D4E3D16|nr:hypothetical protein [Microcoleus sp. PH2017_13_LAR_U_A]MCC3557310.1 hypothetical protein [Microcoleus sp. PH2017_35_SFW_U_B]
MKQLELFPKFNSNYPSRASKLAMSADALHSWKNRIFECQQFASTPATAAWNFIRVNSQSLLLRYPRPFYPATSPKNEPGVPLALDMRRKSAAVSTAFNIYLHNGSKDLL